MSSLGVPSILYSNFPPVSMSFIVTLACRFLLARVFLTAGLNLYTTISFTLSAEISLWHWVHSNESQLFTASSCCLASIRLLHFGHSRYFSSCNNPVPNKPSKTPAIWLVFSPSLLAISSGLKTDECPAEDNKSSIFIMTVLNPGRLLAKL